MKRTRAPWRNGRLEHPEVPRKVSSDKQQQKQTNSDSTGLQQRNKAN